MPDFNFRILINNSQALVGLGEESAPDAATARQQAEQSFLEHCDNCGQLRPPEGTYTVYIDE